ncbi:MAG: nitroreductase [Lachnospiraceae bacterium]|nr:nitroreductase [Lachnospiraceae bacterium]
MEFQKVIEARRSMRAYDASRTVTEEQVREIVKAATLAPSWKNSETARYYCILCPEKCKEFAEECLPQFNMNNSAGAALIVSTFVAGNAGFDVSSGTPVNECGDGWGYYDLGLHNEIFLLKAKEMGLDTLVMGIRNADKIREKLQIPDDETIVSVIALGYGAKEAAMPSRKEVSDILKFL